MAAKTRRGFVLFAGFMLAVILSLLVMVSVVLPQEAQAQAPSMAATTAVGTAEAKVSPASPSPPVKMVLIGDSYSTRSKARNIVRPWPERVSDALGVAEGSRVIFRQPGCGFAKPGHRFLSLLKKAKRDASVTDVLIVGGAGNDRSTSLSKVKAWYRVTVKRLRYLYPNATIMHTITSWDLNNMKYRKIIKARIPCYRALAKKHGVTYLYGCETVMRGHPEYFSKDGRHPNERGQRAMSNRIVAKIKRYNARYASAVNAADSQALLP